MRLTALGKRMTLLTALLGVSIPGSGCHRVPYLDQNKVVPREPAQPGEASERVAQEDAQIQQAALFQEEPTAIPLPRISAPGPPVIRSGPRSGR